MPQDSNFEFNYLQLKSFIYVAELKNYSAAAKALGKSRSTISEHIDSFEDEIGQRLFVKTGRALELTPVGKEIFSHSVLLRKQVVAWQKVVENSLHKSKKKVCRVAYTDAVPREILLLTLKQINAEGEQLELIEIGQSIGHDMLQSEEVDLLIAPTITMDRSKNYDNEWRIVGAMPFRFYAHEEFFSSTPVNITDLVSNTQLLPRAYKDKYEDSFLIFTTNNISITDLFLFEEALKNKMGWAFLPMHLEASNWDGVVEISTDLGDNGYITPISARWRNGESHHVINVLNALEVNISKFGHSCFMKTPTVLS